MYNAVIPSYKKPDEKTKKKTKPGKGKSFGDFISQMKQLKSDER